MPGPLISLVVAMADDAVIGQGGGLPWHLPDDLKHFRAVTIGKPVLMGRRTFEAIGKPLPGRRNLVLSRRALETQGRAAAEGPAAESPAVEGPGAKGGAAAGAAADGVERIGSFEQALARVAGAPELCVIGGAQLYALALPYARCIHMTQVHGKVGGDVFFPVRELGPGWCEVERVEHPADARHAFPMSFLRLERTGPASAVTPAGPASASAPVRCSS